MIGGVTAYGAQTTAVAVYDLDLTDLGYKYFRKTTVNGSADSIAVCLSSEPDTIDPL